MTTDEDKSAEQWSLYVLLAATTTEFADPYHHHI